MIERLDIRARHVIWGHSHRSGPWPGDDAAEWTAATGAQILNTGSWVYQPHFLSPHPNGSPYWPGTAVIVDEDGPPRLVRLLGERGHDDPQTTPGVKQVAWTVTPSPTSSASSPAVWRACSISAKQPGSVDDAARAPLTRTTPAPSTTTHTPPASYGPGVGARLVLGLRGDQRVLARPRGAPARPARATTPSSAWISRSVST